MSNKEFEELTKTVQKLGKTEYLAEKIKEIREAMEVAVKEIKELRKKLKGKNQKIEKLEETLILNEKTN